MAEKTMKDLVETLECTLRHVEDAAEGIKRLEAEVAQLYECAIWLWDHNPHRESRNNPRVKEIQKVMFAYLDRVSGVDNNEPCNS